MLDLRSVLGIAGGLAIVAASASAEDYLVRTEAELEEAVTAAKPGDDIVMAAQVWRDIEIVFDGIGLENAPITLSAEVPGQTLITGQSSLRIGGEHLIVSNLVFQDGYAPSDEVVSFRLDDGTPALNARLSGVVIQNFSKPDRREQDHWVVLSGRNNVVEKSAFLGKTNKGPTLVVRLDTPGSDENGHLIEGNYFGPRSPLGGNGGETIRIGTSFTSRLSSGTTIRGNLFERCDGEVEIISIKSQNNLVTENLFYESRGSVVFRHGGRNTVSRNVFLGNGVEGTGGIRVINDRQTVSGNYLEGLRGDKFLGALVIMNGVPNSPDNRYHQVDGAVIENNSFVDIRRIGLGVGSDEERSAPPIDTVLAGNLLTSNTDDPVRVFDDVSGIAFGGNVTDHDGAKPFAAGRGEPFLLERADNGLLYPQGQTEPGAPLDLKLVDRDGVGPEHFEKPPLNTEAMARDVVPAEPGALEAALAEATAGSILTLAPGRHQLSRPITISIHLTLKGARRGRSSLAGGNGLFRLEAGADLTLERLEILQSQNGSSLHAVGDVYRGAYQLRLVNVTATGTSDDAGAPLVSGTRESFASSIVLEDAEVRSWMGNLLDLNGEGLDGWYLADRIEITGGRFHDVSGALVSFGRDGRDESTYGPRFVLKNSMLKEVGMAGEAVRLVGIDAVEMTGNTLRRSGEATIKRRVLGLPFLIDNNRFRSTPQPTLIGVDGEPMAAEAKP